jgi:chaperonin GroEL
MPLRVNPGMPPPKKYKPENRKPAVIFQPNTYQELKNGINVIANAIRPTLGPLPRNVGLEKYEGKELPEILDDGATIARRIIQINPRGWDVGAMLIRHALWKMYLEVGDGSTTMGVIYQAIVNEGIRYIVECDSNAMLVRLGLEKGLKTILEVLHKEAVQLSGRQNIAKIARGMCQGDLEMADLLGEIFDIVGPDGMIIVEGGNKPGLEREYVEGTYWDISGWFSRHFVTEPIEKRTIFEDAALLITDLAITDPNPLIPVLEKCVKSGVKRLVIIAKEVSDSVIGLLVNNNRAKTIETMAVRTPRVQEMDRVANMEDIAVLSGGKAFYSAANDAFANFQVENLGYVRRAWATESLFGIYGGKGDPRVIRQHIVYIRGMLNTVNTKDEFEKEKLQKRIGRLLGGTAILRVGGITETERTVRKNVALRAVSGLRHAMRGGVVPGGGAGLINAQASLLELKALGDDEAIAFKILARALEEPMRTIADNAGYQPDIVIEKVKLSPKNFGFDALSGKIVDMAQNGILDSVLVLEKALEIAISGAAMMLTTDVIVHHKKPKESIEP